MLSILCKTIFCIHETQIFVVKFYNLLNKPSISCCGNHFLIITLLGTFSTCRSYCHSKL